MVFAARASPALGSNAASAAAVAVQDRVGGRHAERVRAPAASTVRRAREEAGVPSRFRAWAASHSCLRVLTLRRLLIAPRRIESAPLVQPVRFVSLELVDDGPPTARVIRSASSTVRCRVIPVQLDRAASSVKLVRQAGSLQSTRSGRTSTSMRCSRRLRPGPPSRISMHACRHLPSGECGAQPSEQLGAQAGKLESNRRREVIRLVNTARQAARRLRRPGPAPRAGSRPGGGLDQTRE